MPIRPGLFSANALFGDTSIRNGYANVTLGIQPFALEGNISFFLDLRTDSTSGTIVASTPEIKLVDLSSFVSFVANTYTISEGQDVLFTLTTTNAANNAVLYYTIDPQTANLNAADFFGAANSGSFLLVNDVGTILLNANADLSQFPEHGETFKVQVRTASVSGNIVATSDNVVIQDTSNVATFFISPSSASIVEGSNVTFTITSLNVTDGTEVFYTTVGNVRNYNFVEGNTGSFIIQSGANSITLTGTAIPPDQLRQFNLQIREGSTSGPVRGTSGSSFIVDSSLGYLSATGGSNIEILGNYKTHVFTSSANLVVERFSPSPIFNTIDYLVVAGGGSGGGGGGELGGSGGGAGGFRDGNVIIDSGNTNFTVIVGAGGGGNGSDSQFYTIVSTGGGAGGGNPGGSGGGAVNSRPIGSGGGAGNTPPVSPPQGNPGGSTSPAPPSRGKGGAGGGGAGGGGGPGPDGSGAGGGGVGRISMISPNAFGTPAPSGRYFAGGGGGQLGNYSGSGAGGGAGGGGSGSGPSGPGSAGTVNTGGAGGASGFAGGSGIVIIRYPFVPVSTYSLTSSNTVYEGDAITFSLTTTNVSNNYVLYYRTRGNVVSSDFITSNTGSITVVNNSANLILTANSNLTAGQSKDFVLEILEGAVDGDLVVNSNTVLMIDNPFILATGGTTLISGGYKIHTFSTSGNLTISSLGSSPSYNTVDYLVVGGGGGAGAFQNTYPPIGVRASGSGGGAGGFRTGNVILSESNVATYTITVGAGGTSNVNGGSSTFLDIVSLGGGAGWGAPGGSGGGGLYNVNGAAIPGGSGTPGQGNPGGSSLAPPNPPATVGGNGGGGAGGAGNPAPRNFPGNFDRGANGGIGASVTWVPASYGTTGPTPGRWFGGGGSGAGYTQFAFPDNTGYYGGAGGGGNSLGFDAPLPARAGTTNTGGGGAGSGNNNNPNGVHPGGTGGSGIVIIRYPYS